MRKGQSVTAGPAKSEPLKEKLPASIVDCTDKQLTEFAAMPAPPRVKYRRKLSEQDFEDIAKLIAKRLTATEACHVLGIIPQSFFDWKCRGENEARFSDILHRVKGNYVNARIAEIEDSAAGIGVKQRDWRASAWLAQVTGGDRYNVSGKPSDVSVTVNAVADQRLEAVLKRMYNQPVVEVKPLDEPPAVPLLPQTRD